MVPALDFPRPPTYGSTRMEEGRRLRAWGRAAWKARMWALLVVLAPGVQADTSTEAAFAPFNLHSRFSCTANGSDVDDDEKAESSRLKLSFAASVASIHLKPGGRVIGDGAGARVDLALARTGNLFGRDTLTVGASANEDFESGRMTDATFSIEYSIPTGLFGSIVGGYDRAEYHDRLHFGYEHWSIEERGEDKGLHTIFVKWDHESRSAWSVAGIYGFSEEQSGGQGLLDFEMSRKFPLEDVSRSFFVTPSIGIARGFHWYDQSNGTMSSVELAFGQDLHRRAGLLLTYRLQHVLTGDEEYVKDEQLLELQLDVRF